MIRPPPTSTLFPTRRSSDLGFERAEDVGESGPLALGGHPSLEPHPLDRKSTRLNSSHRCISYAVFCLKKKKINITIIICNHIKYHEVRIQDHCNYTRSWMSS